MATDGRPERTESPKGDPGGEFEPKRLAKVLLRTARYGALATSTQSQTPFATLVQVATLPDGAPLVLASGRASHSRNLERTPHCSLMLMQLRPGNLIAQPRLTLEARATHVPDPEIARERFLRHHPRAAAYAGLGDMLYWRLDVQAAHLFAGFGRGCDLSPEDLLTLLDGAEDLIRDEPAILTDLNEAHSAALQHLAKGDGGGWLVSGLDPEGIDLISGDFCERIAFDRRVVSREEFHAHVAELLSARKKSVTGCQ